MAGLLKRFGRKENDTADGVDELHQDSITRASLPSSKSEQDVGKSSARDVAEIEANRKLSVFEKAHRWDPNLDNDQLDEIDEAVNARDPNAEGKLYEEVFENSLYPEV